VPLSNVILLLLRQEIRPAGKTVLETGFESDQAVKELSQK